MITRWTKCFAISRLITLLYLSVIMCFLTELNLMIIKTQVATLTGHSLRVLYLAMSPDGQVICLLILHVYHIHSFTYNLCVRKRACVCWESPTSHIAQVLYLAMSPDGQVICLLILHVYHIHSFTYNLCVRKRACVCWESPTSHIAQVMGLTWLHIPVWAFHISA